MPVGDKIAIMGRKTISLVAVIFIAAFVGAPSQGASISQPNSETPTDIRFAGSITEGDAERLESLLAKLQAITLNPAAPLASIYFDSSGGYLGEALKVGRVLRKYKARSIVASGESCIDACAWAFLGGAEPGRILETQSGRYLYPGARLSFRGLTREWGSQLDRVEIGQLLSYGVDMEIEREWMMRVMRTKPGISLQVETVGHLFLLDIKLGVRPPLSLSLNEQAINVCNHVTGWRRILYTDYTTDEDLETKYDLGGPGNARELSPAEAKSAVLAQIWEKRGYIPRESGVADDSLLGLIKHALEAQDISAINGLYDDLKAIGFPFIDVAIGKTFLVDGWMMVGAGFYTEACLVNIDADQPDRVEVLRLHRGGVLAPSWPVGSNGYLFRFDRNFKII